MGGGSRPSGSGEALDGRLQKCLTLAAMDWCTARMVTDFANAVTLLLQIALHPKPRQRSDREQLPSSPLLAAASSHCCEVAEKLWSEDRIPIGRCSEQGNEHANALTKRQLNKKSACQRTTELSTNWLAVALKKLHRTMFQIKKQRYRKRDHCAKCRRECAGAGCTMCAKATSKLTHFAEGKRCWHSTKYVATPSRDDIRKAYENCELLQ